MTERILHAEMTVSEIAAQYPATLRALEALGIDFCCGGKRPLVEAAAKARVPVGTAIAVLQAAIAQAGSIQAPERDWTREPLEALLTHIVETHHAYTWRELPRLEKMLALVARVHGPSHGDVLQPLQEKYRLLKAELTEHLGKEEQEVFPAVRRHLAGECGSGIAASIALLGEEHDAAGSLLAAMRAITHGYAVPEDACNTFRALFDGLQALEQDLHQHIHLENNILFPRAMPRGHTCRCAA